MEAFGSPMAAEAIIPPLKTRSRLHAEEHRLPEHEVGELADLDAADVLVDAVGDRRVDRVLGDVALGAEVVVLARLAGQAPALAAHLVGGLPGADHDLADPAHRLAVGGHHREGAEVVQDVLGRDRLLADAALGEGHVLGDARVEVVAHHQHVEVLVHGVDRVGPRRVGGGGKDVRLAAEADDVGRVAAAGPLGVVGVDRAALEGGDRVLDEAGLVQRVGVDRDLDVELVGDVQAVVDGGGRGAPVLVQLQAAGARRDLLDQRLGPGGVALAEEAEVDRQALGRLEHPLDVPGAGRAGGGVGAGGRPGAAAEHGRDARVQRFLDELRADPVDVGVDPAGGDDAALARDRLGARPDDDVDVRLHVRVAGLADADDAAVADADVGLDDAPVVEDQRVGDDGVDRPVGAVTCDWPMPSRITLPPPKLISSP